MWHSILSKLWSTQPYRYNMQIIQKSYKKWLKSNRITISKSSIVKKV